MSGSYVLTSKSSFLKRVSVSRFARSASVRMRAISLSTRLRSCRISLSYRRLYLKGRTYDVVEALVDVIKGNKTAFNLAHVEL